MKDFFSVEGPLYKFLSRFYELLKLNIMWLVFGGAAECVGGITLCVENDVPMDSSLYAVCFLPLLFIGPATVAAYTVTLRMADEKEGYIGASFLKAYKENFLKGFLLGIITLTAVVAVLLDFWIYGKKQELPFLIVGIFAVVISVSHLLYAYALQARYENTIINTLRNSHSIAFKYFLRTLFTVVIVAVLVVVFLWNTVTWFLGILIGPCTIFYMISSTAMYIFRLIEKDSGE
ncbi:MAG: YesL family protein [Lachnospiraceae bacterium]|nr:YesL family protein [Lachnospiraceae bacterium]